jgi:hypothetical protein
VGISVKPSLYLCDSFETRFDEILETFEHGGDDLEFDLGEDLDLVDGLDLDL